LQLGQTGNNKKHSDLKTADVPCVRLWLSLSY